MDAGEQCSFSRIRGGVDPPCDDLPGRHMGNVLGADAVDHALRHFDGQISCPADLAAPQGVLNFFDVQQFLNYDAAGGP